MFARYVALGDSQTEGLNDGNEVAGYRGWADRLAERLAQLNPDLRYANLAVRGLLASQVRERQLGPALATKPDLATVVAGMNDLLRPRFDAHAVADELEAMFAELTATGARVATVTFPDIGRITPMVRGLVPRVTELNARIKTAAARYDVVVFDTFRFPLTTDRQMWSTDRIHASPVGHARIALGMAEALGLPGADRSWATPLPVLRDGGPGGRVATELRWLGTFVLPWLARRAKRRSSSEGRSAKRPKLQRVFVQT